MKLAGKVAFITGGGRAIDLACVEALAEAGAKVVIADFAAGIAETGRDELRAGGISGRLACIFGTSACIMATSPDPLFAAGVWGPHYSALTPGVWLNEGGQSAIGAAIDHLVRMHRA
ncbi:MAG: hypothetical protein JNM13_09580 [Hyphomicrobiaceae bacterium]|nr:hypothetical protein [Hyphomicrobiaceae bacterium]